MPRQLLKERIGLLFLLCCLAFTVSAQSMSAFDLMRSDSIMDIYLALDWKELEKKKTDKEYLDAKIRFNPMGRDPVIMDLKVRTRGHMRLDICYFPPLKLKFDKNDLAIRSLTDHNEIDLVHHCQTGEPYEQMVLKEYLAYKLYQVLSPVSFDIHLVRIHYIDHGGLEIFKPSIGFVVENMEELVSKVEGRRVKVASISKQSVDPKCMLRIALFQYMVGNTDWSVRTRHNLDFLVMPGYSLMLAVPYDFDYSGLVSAPYAAHHESIKLPLVSIRYYQGRCVPPEMFNEVAAEFIHKKDELLKLPSQVYGLNTRTVQHATEYLQDFFTILEDPKKCENNIIKHCDRWPVAGEN